MGAWVCGEWMSPHAILSNSLTKSLSSTLKYSYYPSHHTNTDSLQTYTHSPHTNTHPSHTNTHPPHTYAQPPHTHSPQTYTHHTLTHAPHTYTRTTHLHTHHTLAHAQVPSQAPYARCNTWRRSTCTRTDSPVDGRG